MNYDANSIETLDFRSAIRFRIFTLNFTKTANYFNTDKTYISAIIRSMGYNRRTWEEINNKDHGSTKRKVNKIDSKTGKVLKTYNSITEAAIDMGDKEYAKTISSTCKGKQPTFLGYCWQYVEDIGKPIFLNKQQNNYSPRIYLKINNY